MGQSGKLLNVVASNLLLQYKNVVFCEPTIPILVFLLCSFLHFVTVISTVLHEKDILISGLAM